MADDRPKLLVIGSDGGSPGGAQGEASSPSVRAWQILASSHHVSHALPGQAAEHLARGEADLVLADGRAFATLEQLVEHLRVNTILNALGEGICIADADGQILWGNAEFHGYSDAVKAKIADASRRYARTVLGEIGSGSVSSSQGPGSGEEQAAQATQGVGAGPQSNDRRRYEITTDPASSTSGPGGSTTPGSAGEGVPEARTYEVVTAAIPPLAYAPASGGGSTVGGARARVVAVTRDISVLRRQQQKMEAIDRAGDELVRLDRDTIRKLNTAERLRVVEQKIVKFAHDLLHFDQFAIRLVDDKSQRLELVMSQGLPSEAMEIELYARREGNGISGFVASTGKSYICADVTRDPRYVLGIDEARSSLTIPLRLSDRVIGVFNVESTRVNAFTEEDRQFGEMFSRWIALALHFLDLLVVERSTTGQAVTGNVEGELAEPLADIADIAARLKAALAGAAGQGAAGNAGVSNARLIERIIQDVESIKRRVKDVAAGPATILGAERAITDATLDPVIAGKRILIADDDPRIRQIAQKVLRSRGAEVLVCEDGLTAIAALTQIGSASGPGPAVSSGGPGEERTIDTGPAQVRAFDLLVSDIRLPDKTGYEIFAAARKIHPTLPVILMTGFGYDPHHSIVRASQEGLQCVLFKPFQAERLIEEVHKALARSHPPEQAGEKGS